MKIVSLNIGVPKHIFWNNKSFHTSIFKAPTKKTVEVKYEGIIGDAQANTKVHGGVDKAIYAYSADHYVYWKNLLKKDLIEYGMFGENLTLTEFQEDKINFGDIFKLGSIEMMAVQPRQPCSKLGMRFDDITLVKKFWDADKPGVYFRIIKEGKIKLGDELVKIGNTEFNISILDIYKMVKGEQIDFEKIAILLNHEKTPASLRDDLFKSIK